MCVLDAMRNTAGYVVRSTIRPLLENRNMLSARLTRIIQVSILLLNYQKKPGLLQFSTAMAKGIVWRPMNTLQSLLDTVPGQLAHIPKLASFDEAKAAQVVCKQEGH